MWSWETEKFFSRCVPGKRRKCLLIIDTIMNKKRMLAWRESGFISGWTSGLLIKFYGTLILLLCAIPSLLHVNCWSKVFMKNIVYVCFLYKNITTYLCLCVRKYINIRICICESLYTVCFKTCIDNLFHNNSHVHAFLSSLR